MTNVLIRSESEFKNWIDKFCKFDKSLRFFYNMPCNYPFYIFYYIRDDQKTYIDNAVVTFINLRNAEYMVRELKEQTVE